MKSRAPLAGYIAVILMYWALTPTIFLTFVLVNGPPAPLDPFAAKVLADAGISIFLAIALILSRIFFISSDLENLLLTGISK